MRISQLARSIPQSSTLRLNEEARFLREKGEPVIHLGIGEPKNKAPFAALLSAGSKLTSGDIKYTPTDGLPSLKKAILRYMEENYNKLLAPENIIATAGAKQSIFNILFSVVDPQDEVIILAPYWVSYPEMVKMVNGVPVLVTPEDGTFHPRLADIERAVSSRTRAVIVNNPNNPSGAVYSEAFISDIVGFCERRGICLIMDDLYHRLVFDGLRAPRAYDYTDRDIETSHVIVVNGVSKAYGMTGIRIGWVAAPRKLVEVLTNVQSQMVTNPPAISQAAAEGALIGVQSAVESLRLTIQNNRDVVVQELRTLNGIYLRPPQGTFYALPDFRAFNPKSVELAEFLLRKALVVTVPGADFGAEGHLRISFAGAAKEVKEGIERIRWALDPASPSEIYIGDRKMVRDWL